MFFLAAQDLQPRSGEYGPDAGGDFEVFAGGDDKGPYGAARSGDVGIGRGGGVGVRVEDDTEEGQACSCSATYFGGVLAAPAGEDEHVDAAQGGGHRGHGGAQAVDIDVQ